jgi:hypothetical protein
VLAHTQGAKEGTKPLVYNDTTDSSPTFDRTAKNALADKFRFIDTTQKEGFAPARVKGYTKPWNPPTGSRARPISGTARYIFVVTPDGRVIEPRVLNSPDPAVSKYILDGISYRRFFPARFHGAPVYALHEDEFKVSGPTEHSNGLSKDGLGFMGGRDR